jgi:hypothetical protein
MRIRKEKLERKALEDILTIHDAGYPGRYQTLYHKAQIMFFMTHSYTP